MKFEEFGNVTNAGVQPLSGEFHAASPVRRAPRDARSLRRRSSVFARILEDASRGAREYVERWVAGRGAE